MRPNDPRLWRILAPARLPLTGMLGAGLLSAVLVIAQAWVVAALVIAVVGDHQSLSRWALATAGVLALRGLAGWCSDVCAAQAARGVGTALRVRLAEAGLARGASRPDPVLVTRGVAAAEPYLTRYLPAVALAGLLPPMVLIAIATQDWLSAVIVGSTLPLIPVFGALVGMATQDRAERQWRSMTALSGHFLDVMRGLPTLVAYRRARAQAARIAEITDRYRRASLATLRIAFASSAVLELVATLSVALVAVTIGVRLAQGEVGLHTALVVLLLAPEAYWPLRRMGAEFHAASEGVATFEAVAAILDGVEPRETAGAPLVADAPLRLDGVAVTYPGRVTPALARLDAVIAPRGITAVVGPSGCGKSTLIAAIADLVDHDGAITLGGLPAAGEEWQRQVALLAQRPVFVAGSLADNLRLGAPTASDADLWAALRSVALELRFAAEPDGLDHRIGQDGVSLSAGERARLALARIVLAVRVGGRGWVLLDEPTAHLDEVTEQVITDVVVELSRMAGVVVVAHRPALVEVADAVIELAEPDRRAPDGSTGRPDAVQASHTTRERPMATAASAEAVEPRRVARQLWGATALGALASASGVALTATAGWLIVTASARPPVLTMMVAIVGVRTFGLARPALRYVERLRSHDAALLLLARRRVEIYEALVPLAPARLGVAGRRGEVLSAIVDDVDSVVDTELRVRMPIRTAVAVIGLAAVVALALDPASAGLIGGVLAGTAGVAWLLASLGADRAEERALRTRAALSESVVETIDQADELRMWQRLEERIDHLGRISDRLGGATVRSAIALGSARFVVLAGTGLAVAATALTAARAVDHAGLSGPMAALLVLIPLALADVVLPVADAGALGARTRRAQARLQRWQRLVPAVRDTVALSAPTSNELNAQAVVGRWAEDAPLTAPVDLRLRPGERVALVGPSGSGKSTVAALMLRFLDPVAGSITLGGPDLRMLALDEVRQRVGLVDDDPHIFASTVAENVRLARPEAGNAEVEVALRRAGLAAWVADLPDGIDTWVGAGHSEVSGGERARLAIARSILADQPVLVLDEPTAHLDHDTASRIAQEVLAADDGRAVLWITHRPDGLDLVDRVAEVEAGVRD